MLCNILMDGSYFTHFYRSEAHSCKDHPSSVGRPPTETHPTNLFDPATSKRLPVKQEHSSDTEVKMVILMSQHVISIREIIAIALTMAERTDFVDRPAPVDGLNTKGCDPETICCPNHAPWSPDRNPWY